MQAWNKWRYNGEGKKSGGLSEDNEDTKWDESNAGGRACVGEGKWTREIVWVVGLYLPGNNGKPLKLQERVATWGQAGAVTELWIIVAHLNCT